MIRYTSPFNGMNLMFTYGFAPYVRILVPSGTLG